MKIVEKAAPVKVARTLSGIFNEVEDLPFTTSIQAVPGWGKTSLAAQAPKPLFLMAGGETGLLDLKRSGQVSKEVAYLPELKSWEDTLEAVKMLTETDHDYKSFVFDAMTGFEELCHLHVCQREWPMPVSEKYPDGCDWGDKGFDCYKAGFGIAIKEWRSFLRSLDELRETKKALIILIGHVKIKPFKNPEGPDWDRYTVDMHEKTWNITLNWLSQSFFGNYITRIDESKNKATGGNQRYLYVERTAAYDAKNKDNLSVPIKMGDNPAKAWDNLTAQVKNLK